MSEQSDIELHTEVALYTTKVRPVNMDLCCSCNKTFKSRADLWKHQSESLRSAISAQHNFKDLARRLWENLHWVDYNRRFYRGGFRCSICSAVPDDDAGEKITHDDSCPVPEAQRLFAKPMEGLTSDQLQSN